MLHARRGERDVARGREGKEGKERMERRGKKCIM